MPKPGDARPYRLRDVRKQADRVAQFHAWHAFISYTHVPDGALAVQLRRYLMRVTRPWWGFSNLRVFLDQAAMLPGAELSRQIARTLSSSAAMMLLAGPASAGSRWVAAEIMQWMAERDERPLLVVQTGGVLEFRSPPGPDAGAVDWEATTALDPAPFRDTSGSPQVGGRTIWVTDLAPVAERLAGAVAAAPTSTPRTTPLRLRQAGGAAWAAVRLRRDERAALRETASAIVAEVLDLDRDRLSSLERRRRRRAVATTVAAVVALVALSTVAVIEQVRAQRAADVALSQQLAAASLADAPSDPDVASLLAVQAYRTAPTAEASSAVITAAAGPLQDVLRGHGAEVTSVAVAGTIAVTGSADGTARVWDTRTGAAVRVIRPDCGEVWHVLVSADARLLLTVCRSVVRSWDATSGAPLRSFAVEAETFFGVAYTAGRDTALVEGERGVGWLWQPREDRLLHSLPGHTGRVTTAAFTADGTTLATGDEAGNVRLWNTATGALEGVLAAGTGFVSELTFSGDGATLAVADNDATASLWRVSDRSRLHLLTGALSGVRSVAISPDGRTVATGDVEGSVRTWDTATGSPQHTMTGGFPGVWAVRFSHDGRVLLTVSENHTASLWDARSGDLDATLTGHTDAVRAGEFCPDDTCVITAGADGTARLWKTTSVVARHTYDVHSRGVHGIGYDRGGDTLGTVVSPGAAYLFDPHTLAAPRTLDVGPGGQGIDFSPDGQTVVTGGDDHLVRIWDRVTARQLMILSGHGAAVSGVSFSPDGAMIASTGNDGTVRLWDSRTGALLHTLHVASQNPWTLAFDPTGELLAATDNGERVRIWDTRSGALLREVASPFSIINQSNNVRSVAFSPDSSLLATAGEDHAVCLWDPRTGKLVRALRDTTAGIRQLEFSPDGTLIAAAGDEHLARVWDVRTGTPRFVLGGYGDGLTGLDFSRDGRLIAVAGYDGTLRFWDAHTGQPLKVVHAHLGFDLVVFDPDGTSLTDVGFDGEIRTWDPPPPLADALTAVCHAVGRDLTDAEWARYAPGRPTPRTCS